jgi:imidazolonepropionase
VQSLLSGFERHRPFREGTRRARLPLAVVTPRKRSAQAPRPLLLANIGQLLTLRTPSDKPGPRRGRDLSELSSVKDAAVLCLGGKIVSVGKTKDAIRDPWLKKNRTKVVEIDCAGRLVLPGLVDSHTHPAFISPRLADFEKRISGVTYEQIAEAGGGIRSSVEGVRTAAKAVLAQRVLDAFHEMAEQGTTTIEAKSGYGLTLASEIKSLDAIRQATTRWPGTVVSTLLGAHVVPQEFRDRPADYVEVVCGEMIPEVARQGLARFVDVFCDRGAFSPDDTAKIFAAAEKHGLSVRAHVGQLSETPLAPFMRFQPASFDHMDHVLETDLPELAKNNTVATLVPGANYFLGLETYPPARMLIDAGVPVALATDYNPGSSPTASMPFVLSLACTHMKMSPAEAISAATINGAWALRLADRKGSIEPGKDADLTAFDVQDYRELAYWIASTRCAFTVLGGSKFPSQSPG